MSKLVSIIIPVYNAEKYLNLALDSIIYQSYSNIEFLIADDASTDSSKLILDQYQDHRIKRFDNIKNLGYLQTCNKLFALATGDYITFQDADDISEPDRIERIINLIGDYDIVTTSYHFINSNGDIYKQNEWEIDYTKLKVDSTYNPYLCGQTIFMRSELYKTHGGYHPFFDRLGGEDYEWLFRIFILSDCKAKHLSDRLYYYRVHQSAVKTGNTNIKKNFVMDLVFLIKKNLIDKKEYLLDDKNSEYFEKIVSAKEAYYSKNPSLLFINLSHAKINENLYFKAIEACIVSIRKQPFFFKAYKNFFYCLYVISRRIIAF